VNRREDRFAPDGSAVLTVGQLTNEIRGVLDATFGSVWVQGEISQPRTPASGHVYLTLKDDEAVLPAVIWRSTAARLRFQPEDGQEVLVQGSLDVYPPHGRYQMVIRRLEPLGEGALRLAFEQLRRKLEAEGLFDPARKRPLPPLPKRIALVTSRTGAAVRDMVTVITRRFPNVAILLVPARVQGEGSAREIATALHRADTRARADVIIVGRGGGSLEDLWAFNEEVVARAIHACKTPVVSAVGHETDTTIADLVADVRAATPSQAGELVVPVKAELLEELEQARARLLHRMQVRVGRAWQRLEALGDRPVLREAGGILRTRARLLASLGERLAANTPVAQLARRSMQMADLGRRLRPPLARRLARAREALGLESVRLTRAAGLGWERRDRRLVGLDDRLRALSPLAVLGRGYAIARRLGADGLEGAVVRQAEDVAPGDRVRVRLAGGAIDSRVETIVPAQEDTR